MNDYIPNSDSAFDTWQGSLFTMVQTNLQKWNIPEADFSVIKTLRDWWTSTYAAASNRHNRTEAQTVAKNNARSAYKKEIRMFVKRHLAFNAAVGDSERDAMGLTIPSGTRTQPQAPSTFPIVDIDFSTRMRHILKFRDSEATGRAKPDKVHGCEIWTKTGGQPPVNESELTYLGTDTKSPHTIDYRGDQQGTVAHYWLRWVNARGEHGPWSAPASAIIA
ncbi:MAG: hypothetical protein LBV26_09060 [Bacteroidales bacterium]|jgi:hypothetical protein|nr:hypothetical protein [Bacteroidales bacterium]